MKLPLELEYSLMCGSPIAYSQAEALGFTPEAYGFIKGKEGRYTMEEAMKSKEKSPLFEGVTSEKEIPGYIQRMIEEKNELAERKNKLSAFIESGKAIELSSADYMDLLLQLNAMEEYHLILERRLNRAFNKEGIA